jgi:hypothetical protein
LSDTYLALEPLLIARLQSQVPGLAQVLPWSDPSTVMQSPITFPEALVVYRGDKEVESEIYGATVAQKWSVFLLVQAPATADTQAEARAVGGPFITQILQAVHGWEPDNFHKECRFSAPGVKVSYQQGGITIFEIPFTVVRSAF